jgi:hypothetical protein
MNRAEVNKITKEIGANMSLHDAVFFLPSDFSIPLRPITLITGDSFEGLLSSSKAE